MTYKKGTAFIDELGFEVEDNDEVDDAMAFWKITWLSR